MNMRGIDPTAIEEKLLALLDARGPGKTLGPMDVARAIGGDHPDGWGPLMQPIRRVAVRLMQQGRVVLLRKGRPVDPEDFRGVYRIALPGHRDEAPSESDVEEGAGGSESERPAKR